MAAFAADATDRSWAFCEAHPEANGVAAYAPTGDQRLDRGLHFERHAQTPQHRLEARNTRLISGWATRRHETAGAVEHERVARLTDTNRRESA